MACPASVRPGASAAAAAPRPRGHRHSSRRRCWQEATRRGPERVIGYNVVDRIVGTKSACDTHEHSSVTVTQSHSHTVTQSQSHSHSTVTVTAQSLLLSPKNMSCGVCGSDLELSAQRRRRRRWPKTMSKLPHLQVAGRRGEQPGCDRNDASVDNGAGVL